MTAVKRSFKRLSYSPEVSFLTQRKLIRASGEGRITLLVINNPQKSIFLAKTLKHGLNEDCIAFRKTGFV